MIVNIFSNILNLIIPIIKNEFVLLSSSSQNPQSSKKNYDIIEYKSSNKKIIKNMEFFQ